MHAATNQDECVERTSGAARPAAIALAIRAFACAGSNEVARVGLAFHEPESDLSGRSAPAALLRCLRSNCFHAAFMLRSADAKRALQARTRIDAHAREEFAGQRGNLSGPQRHEYNGHDPHKARGEAAAWSAETRGTLVLPSTM